MVDQDFIENLFKKNEMFSGEQKDKVEKILEEINQKQTVEKIVTTFTSKLDLAEQIIETKGIAGDSKTGEVIELEPIMPLYYDRSGLWWRWNSSAKKWMIIDEVDLMNYITNTSYANTINSKERGEILQALKQVARRNEPQQAPISWIQFDDEIIDIETGDRFPATSKFFLTNPIPYKLGKKEDTATMDRIFAEWVGEEHKQTLYEIIAYCTLRDYPIHRLFCFIGDGLNGKSKFLSLLKKFIGQENVCSTELDTLLTSRFEVTKLHKKLACQLGETNFNEISKTSILKKLTGQDTIGFEYKNKTPFDDLSYAKILISTNNLPTTSDKTTGFYRRWLIIDFPNKFNEKKDILAEIPEEEYHNLALKCVGFLISVLAKREFHNEGSIEDRTKKYEEKSNPFDKFWTENIIENPSSFIFKNEFRQRLEGWCKENRFRVLSDTSIAKHMKEKGVESGQDIAEWFTKEGTKPRFWSWRGISFKDSQLNQTGGQNNDIQRN